MNGFWLSSGRKTANLFEKLLHWSGKTMVVSKKYCKNISAPKLASSISSEIGEKISAETLRRALHNAGFHGRIPV
ncbi:hypothetical protein TNCV_2168981 [Trichonephila clavipes]|nr:hypothetical protein TNCV_2168981 [Trichonephila clavipes]